MNDIIAKKYAKAIDESNADEFYENLKMLNSAFALPKFKILAQSSQVSKAKKEELILSFFPNSSDKFKNYIKLLIQNSRLDCISHILNELERQRSIRENTYLGKVFTKEELDSGYLNELEQKLSSKFRVNIKLKNEKSEKDGVSIALDELGYEISFSMQALQSKMSEYILKII